MKGIHLARRIARMAWAKKAEDVVILDLRGLTDTTDFFVISTGQVGNHVRAITDFVMDQAREVGEKAHVSERDSDEWMVVDFVDVIFHCFQPQKRRHYNLERLWCDSLRLDLNPVTGTAGTLKAAREDLELRRRTAPLKAQAPPKPTTPFKLKASPKPKAPLKPMATPKPKAPLRPKASPKPKAPLKPKASPKPKTSLKPKTSPKPKASPQPKRPLKLKTSPKPKPRLKS